MDYFNFIEWLSTEKAYGQRSVNDVISRLKRVLTFLGIEQYTEETLSSIESNPQFKKCSVSVKSQMRHACRLYNEYKEQAQNTKRTKQ